MFGEGLSFANQEHQRLLIALRESEILRELAELLASSLNLDTILRVLVKRTTEVCEVERCAVWLLEDARGVFQPTTYHLSSQQLDIQAKETGDALWYRTPLPFDDPVVNRLLNSKGLLVIEDLYEEPSLRKVAESFLVRSVLLVALLRDGRPVGMMSLDNPGNSRTFPTELQQLARAIGQQAAIAIDNARLYQQAQAERKKAEQLIERARSIYQVALSVNSGEDLSSVLGIAIHYLVRGLNADSGAIFLLEADTLRLASATQLQQNVPGPQTTVSLANLPNYQHAASTGTPLFVTQEQAEGSEIQWYRKLGLDNVLIVPLLVGSMRKDGLPSDGHSLSLHNSMPGQETQCCVGLACVNYASPDYRPTRGQFAFAQDIAAQCALAIEKAYLLTDARQAAKLATEHANTLDAVFQTMTEGISVLNMQGEVLLYNKATSLYFGENFSKEQLDEFFKTQSASTLQGQLLRTEISPVTRALQGERIREEQIVVKLPGEAERVLEMNITPIFDNAGKQTGIVSAFRNISEQLRVEQRLRHALETMLHVAEAVSGRTEIKDILQRVLSMTLNTLNCERGLVQLYAEEQQTFTPLLSIGFSKEAEGLWIAEQSRWLAPGTDQYSGFRTQLLDGHATLVNAEQYPLQPNPFSNTMVLVAPIMQNNRVLGLIMLDRSDLFNKESREVSSQNDLSSISTPVEVDTDEFTIWDIAVIEGIAKLAGLAMEQAKWQQEAINARTDEAAMREANALKDEFLAITAHEFRTPLTVILAHSQVALRALRRAGAEQVSTVVDNLSTIEEQIRQLTNIVNTFLEVTQINRGQLTLKFDEVDLAEIAEQVVAEQGATSANHSIRCKIESSGQPYFVRGDSARLRQIIANLVENAIKYSPLGGPITVSMRKCSTKTSQVSIEVCVEDKGIGVPKDAQARLFDRFYRAPNIEGNKTRGTGLGLYVVAQLLQMHGSNICVESSGIYGEGSRFLFSLPALLDVQEAHLY